MGSDPEVLVVGGGVAGLVAARRLALEGRRVTVLEQSSALGGQVARQRVGGADLDAAAESFATRDGTVVRLLTELGLAGDIVLPRSDPAWLHRADGTAVPLPATGLLGIPGDPGAADVVRAIGNAGARRAAWDALLPAWVGADASTLGELVRRRMGRAVVDGLVAPVVRGVHSVEPDGLALDRAAPRLRAELLAKGSLAAAVLALRAAAPAGSQVGGIRGGMFRLVDALAADCERLGVVIERGAQVRAADTGGVVVDGRRREGIVVWACPPFRQRGGRTVTLVTLVVDAPALDGAPRGTGVLVAPGTPGVRARALTHLSAKWTWVAEAVPGRHALRLSYDEAPIHPVATATADAGILTGAVIDRVEDATFATWERAGAAPQTTLPSVGETAAGTGLAAVVAQAERLAREVAASPAIGGLRREG